MSLVPRESWSDLYRLFDQALPSIRTGFEHDSFSPRVDVVEKETAFQIIADLPGVAKEDISVSCNNGVLTIEAITAKSVEHKKDDKIIHQERFQGKMVRSFTLSDNVDLGEIYAEFQDGVLEVIVPKLKNQPSKPTHIEIN
ncbi:Hsp20/alpha crystallin family protein [Vibrio sp.]|uniref:Hsp20/alpha crystallin family protein n=1 Tax=Vibrio viridaestus TaxID=2487322 RepID=A0A3N9TM04_9VIBR|nr:Hsp20/alpha crystallin family protein [Vibrio viridaestus]MDC0610585.1 Hsp20/alpha crystallin family protein [Vibrio sp.]RQW65111.1 Hsp20/alpha crystallin family protein [Vibrio viridaestus]